MANDDKLTPSASEPLNVNLESTPSLDGASSGDAASSGDDVASLDRSFFVKGHSRYTLMQWIVWLNFLVNVLMVTANGLLFVQVRAWQMLATVGVSLLSLGGLILVLRRLDTAGPWLFALLWLNYGSWVLFFEGPALYALISAFLLILVAGFVILPKRWDLLSATLILFSLFIFAVEKFIALPRYQLSNLPGGIVWVWLSSALVYLVVLGGLLLRIVRASSIRVRLMVTSIVFILLPSLIWGTSATILGLQGGRRQVKEQLALAIHLRKSRIYAWVDDLEFALVEILADEEVAAFSQYVLRRYNAAQEKENVLLGDDFTLFMQDTLTMAAQRRLLFQDVLLLDIDGDVILATDERLIGRNYGGEAFFQHGQNSFHASLHLGDPKLVIATIPIISDDSVTEDTPATLGLLVGRATTEQLQAIMRNRIGVGTTGDIYLVAPDHIALTRLQLGGDNIVVSNKGVQLAIEEKRVGLVFYTNALGDAVVESYEWLSRLGVVILAEQSQAEAFSEIYATLRWNIIITSISIVVVLAAIFWITRGIVQPLTELTETALDIAAGDLTRQVPITRMDEVGKLAQTFNMMTVQVRELLANSEAQVDLRMHDLQRRSRYLAASAEVGRAISLILDSERLLNEVVDLILDHFDLYYVGLFLVQEDMAILRAGTGAAGRAMLLRKHGILIGEGMIGWCISHNQSRVALQAETDAVRVTNLELPDTRSEAALPLHSRGQVLGALSVQSSVFDAFDTDTITVLQTMADQVAVALDNARLFAEAQHALESERLAYGLEAQRAWAELLRSHDVRGYSYSRESIVGSSAPNVVETEGAWSAEMQRVHQTGERLLYMREETARLLLPVHVSNRVVGVFRFDKSVADAGWAEDEISLLETLLDQLGQTLERAQLYLQTRQRAAHDRMIATVSSRMRESTNIDAVLQTTVREILGALDLTSVEVRLGSDVAQTTLSGSRRGGGKE